MTQVPGGDVLVYETPEGDVRVDVRLDRDTVWLTQRQMVSVRAYVLASSSGGVSSAFFSSHISLTAQTIANMAFLLSDGVVPHSFGYDEHVSFVQLAFNRASAAARSQDHCADAGNNGSFGMSAFSC